MKDHRTLQVGHTNQLIAKNISKKRNLPLFYSLANKPVHLHKQKHLQILYCLQAQTPTAFIKMDITTTPTIQVASWLYGRQKTSQI